MTSYQRRLKDIAYWKQRGEELESIIREMLRTMRRHGLPVVVPGVTITEVDFLTDVNSGEWGMSVANKVVNEAAQGEKIGMYKGEEVLPWRPPMPPAQFFEQRPDGRWQRFKQDYFPQWLLRRFPVRYKMPLYEQIQQLFDDCSGMPSTARGNKP